MLRYKVAYWLKCMYVVVFFLSRTQQFIDFKSDFSVTTIFQRKSRKVDFPQKCCCAAKLPKPPVSLPVYLRDVHRQNRDTHGL